MIFRIRKNQKFYQYFFILLLFIVFFISSFVVLIYKFPLRSVTANLNTSHVSLFFRPWPAAALDQEFQERKRLKRYAKAEQRRRLERQIQRMDVLNVPLYDMVLDDSSELLTENKSYFADKTDFLWPLLPAKKEFQNSLNHENRKAVHLLFPEQNWTSVLEGVYLSAGDEIRANVPVIKGRRYLNFFLFPTMPGNLRILLGQYVWAKTFSGDDVQKIQKITVPINDQTATTIRILSISCGCYIMDVTVDHIQKNGREPIKVALSSLFWLPSKDRVVKESASESVDQEMDKNEYQPERSQPERLKADIDPLSENENPQILVRDDYTTAFGYNIVLVQLPPVSPELLHNNKLLKRLAPNLLALMEKGTLFDQNIMMSDGIDGFRQTIFEGYKRTDANNIPVLKEKINLNETGNMYQKLRQYGYKVVSITTPESLFFTKNIAYDGRFSSFYNRWLPEKDWEIEKNNVKIDERGEENSGLEAIFKTENLNKIRLPIHGNDYQEISSYLRDTSLNIGRVPDWRPNQYILISNKDYYGPKVLEAFQNWTASSLQTRFLAHVFLGESEKVDKPYLTSLKKSLLAGGFFSITHFDGLKDAAKLSYMDSILEDLMGTIKARRIEHRTLVFILIPDKSGKKASGVYRIPGLIGNTVSSSVYVKDIVATLMSNVGIPTGVNLKNNATLTTANMLEVKNQDPPLIFNNTNTQKLPPSFVKYSLLIQPNDKSCAPFLWKSSNAELFGVSANYPVYENIDKYTLKINPCYLKNKNVFFRLTWYQKNSGLNESAEGVLRNHINGHFYYFKDAKKFPKFFFGKDLVSYFDLSLRYGSPSNPLFDSLFFVDEESLSDKLLYAQKSFMAFDDISHAQGVTRVAVFLTPLN